jgi:hypothetical protein
MVLLLSLVALLLWVPCAHSAEYTFVPVVLPFAGSKDTIVTGLATDGTMVGTYRDGGGRNHGFVWPAGEKPRPLLLVTPLRIHADGQTIIGKFMDGTGQLAPRGFTLHDGTMRTLHGPVTREDPVLAVAAVGMTATGLIVGDYRDRAGVQHGFRYDPATREYETIDFTVPSTQAQGLIAMSPTGILLGFFTDPEGFSHGVLKDGETVTQLDMPGVTTGTRPQGITDDNTVVGFAGTQGFIYRAGAFTPLAYPGATLTQPFGVRGDGVVYGHFTDATQDAGFVAYPPGIPVPATMQPTSAAPAPKRP